MSNLSRKFLLVLGLVLVTGCASNPPYPFTKEEKKAYLKGVNNVAMCKDGSFYTVTTPEGAKAAPIPAGGRVSLGTYMSYSGYNVTYSCYPFLSFNPHESETYLINTFVRENKCYIELVREDQTKETGVAFEPSLGPRDCFVKR